ncbi:hypothetical protein SESBI_43708 [Sesbania bispinosa]|nr:hypothetical protein SESBI_43708 [Sesbania bispinosa]
MGLNLKSQVTFKSIKSAACKPGSFPMLFMPLMIDTINVTNSEESSETLLQTEDVVVFNNRPSDVLHREPVRNGTGSIMVIACENVGKDDMLEAEAKSEEGHNSSSG